MSAGRGYPLSADSFCLNPKNAKCRYKRLLRYLLKK